MVWGVEWSGEWSGLESGLRSGLGSGLGSGVVWGVKWSGSGLGSGGEGVRCFSNRRKWDDQWYQSQIYSQQAQTDHIYSNSKELYYE